MRKIWSQRKERDKRKSFMSIYSSNEQQEHEKPSGGHGESDGLDDQSTLANSTIGSIPESSESDYTVGTKNSVRSVSTLAKNDYDQHTVKNAWLNATVGTSSVHDMSENMLRVYRAELKGSHMYLYKPTVLNARRFQLADATEEADQHSDIFNHNNESGVSEQSVAQEDTSDEFPQLTFFRIDMAHPGLKYDFDRRQFLLDSTVEALVHFLLFQTNSLYTISTDQLIETMPLFPDFGAVIRLVLSFLSNLFDSKLQGEFNEQIMTDRILRLLSNIEANFQGFLVRCEIYPIILKIIEVLSDNLQYDDIVHKVRAFKTNLVGKQNSIIESITYDLPSENPFHDLNSNVFINDINVIEFSKTINFIDLNFFKNWNSNIDKSLLLYSSLKDNSAQDFFYKKNPLVFDNDHHIHYLSRLLINHVFIENTSSKNNNFLERKARLIEKWIDLGCFLEKSGNMSSWLGIASIILSQPILRLTRIWYLVSPDYIRLLKNDWSPVLFELDRRFLVNGSINSDQVSKTSDSFNLKFDDFTSRDSYHIMAPRGLGKIYPKENVIPYFGDLIMNNHSTDINELESIWKRINYSFNRWNEYLSSLTNYDEIIKYNDDVLRRYDNMGFIFSNESLNQVLYLGVNNDDTKPLPAKYKDSSSSNINTDLHKKLLKLIEVNCDSTNLDKIMKLSLLMEPELPESYLKVPTDSQSANSDGPNATISSISIHSNDSSGSLNTPLNDSNISLPSSQQSLGDDRASKIPIFNNNYFKIALAKYDDLLLQNISTEQKSKFQSLDSSVIKHNFVIDDELTLRVDDFVTDLDSSFINSSTLQGLEDDDDDEIPGLGIDVDDILNSDKFNHIDINDNSEPTIQNEEKPINKNKRSKNYSLISSDSSKFSQHSGYIPKYASIDRLIDLLLIDAKYFNENISINLSEYRFVFLLNYNSFITTKELLDKLSHRFINSSNAIISIMKKLYLIKNGNVDIQLQLDFPNWNLDTSVNISELGNVDYEALLEIQTNILKVLIVLINNFYSNFVNDLINKKIFIKLLKLFSNEILQWYNSNKIDSHLEKAFENLVNYYKKLKKLFIKKTYRPIEMSKFDEYLIKEFRFSNSLHDVPINRNLPGHKNLNKVEKFLHKFNKLLTTFYKLIKTEDWIKIYKILENQFEKHSLLGFNLQKASTNDDNMIISNIFNFFESLSDPQEKQLVLKQFPLVFRKLFKLYFKFRSYLLIQLSDLNITVDERLDRMKTLLLMLKISKMKMSDNQFVFDGDQDNIPSCIETAISNVIYLPESRLFASLWIKASMSLNDDSSKLSFDDINSLLPTNISDANFAINEPLLPCFGWIIENLIEANKCPSFHKQVINFNKRYLIYKIIKELCIEDIDGQESNGFNCHENREFDFLLKLDESLVNRQRIKDFIVGQDKERSRLFRSVLHDQHKILALDNKKKHLRDGSGSNMGINPTSSMHTLSKKSSSSSLRRQSLSYKSNSSSRFKISGIFSKSRPFSLNASSTSERIISSNELPDVESYADPKQKAFLIIPLKNKKIFPVYSLPFAFKIDSDSPNEDSFFQAPNENELNDWLVKLNYANRHWFYSKNLNLKANHACSTFGIPIEVVCNRDQSSVPRFLLVMFEEIENEGLKDTGIYRISSSVSELNHVKSIIDKTGTISFNERAYDPHTLASCVKSYFRELPDALLIDQVIESFFILEKESPERSDNSSVIENYRQILKNLPTPNYQTLKLLLKHLQKVSQFSEHNKMTASNLATVIGPALTEASNLDCLINNFGFMNSILEKLITNYDYVFQDGS